MPRQSTGPPTIVSLKQQWLSTQTRLLSTDLAPSKSWRAANDDDKENRTDEGRPVGLPDKAVDDAIWALNHSVQQHAKRVYSRQATRHVAEQIDQLYWDASNRAVDRANGEGDENEEDEEEFRGLTYGADLRMYISSSCLLCFVIPRSSFVTEISHHPLSSDVFGTLRYWDSLHICKLEFCSRTVSFPSQHPFYLIQDHTLGGALTPTPTPPIPLISYFFTSDSSIFTPISSRCL